MKRLSIILLSIFSFAVAQTTAQTSDTLDVTSLGLLPDSRVNATPYVVKAVELCHERPGVVLYFPKGRYDFWPHNAIERVYYESNTTDNNPKRLAILLDGLNGITLDGDGSEFIMHDRIQPITVDNCTDVTLKNFSVDWDIPLTGQGEVTATGEDWFEVNVDKNSYPYIIEKGKLFFTGEGWRGSVTRMMEFDCDTHIIQEADLAIGANWKDYEVTRISPDILRFSRKGGFERYPKTGNIIVFRHNARDHAGMFLNESRDLVLNDITIHHTAGLGILCQYSENLSFERVDVVPNRAKGRYFSGHDDGIHAMGCKGHISIKDCEWEGLMDDPINIHGTCVRIMEVISPTKLRCRFMEGMSVGLRWAVTGDNVGFTNNRTLNSVEQNSVASFTPENEREFILETTEPFSEKVEVGMALENLTWTPSVEIRDSRFLSCRARGLLVSTPGKVVIANNFFASSGSAILIAGDANYWYESGAVTDVTIENNTFHYSVLSSMYQFTEAIISILPEIPLPDSQKPYHRNIKIVNNRFNPFDSPILYATSVDGLTFSGNTIERSYELTPWHPRKAAITIDACKNVQILDNNVIGDVLGKTISIENMSKREVKVSPNSYFEVEVNKNAVRPSLMK
jgi:polygalacturonase